LAHLAAGHSDCLWRDATGHGYWYAGHGSRATYGSRYGFRTQTADAGQGSHYTGHDFSRYAGHFNMRDLLPPPLLSLLPLIAMLPL
jgi:hypothetical protein